MIYFIDRFEGELAVLCDEAEGVVTVKRDELPAEAKVGHKLIRTETGYLLDEKGTEARRAQVRQLQEKLRRRS